MNRFLVAVALCVATAISGAWTLQWTPSSDGPAGTTVTACLNDICVNGITGTSQAFSEVYPPGTVLHGTAQAVPPAGSQCGDPPVDCQNSVIAEISQTIPADQQYPNTSAWVATGGLMAAPTFVAKYATAFGTATTPKTAMSAVSVSNGEVLVGGASSANSSAVMGATENGAGSWNLLQYDNTSGYCSIATWQYSVSASETLTTTFTESGTGEFGGTVLRFSGSSGIGNSVKALASSGTPSVNITTTQDNSAIFVYVADWNGVAGTQTFTSNGGAGSPTQVVSDINNMTMGVAVAYYADAGAAGTKTVGMSSPTGQAWTIIAVEVKGASAGTTYTHAASGGIITGGTATLKRTKASTASGGVSTGGTATLKRTQAIAATGGVTTGGAASASKSSGNSYIASGGITTGGAATLKRTQASTASGGISTGGTGGLKLVKTVSGSGGVATSGAAALKRAFARFSSGGLVTGGTAALKLVKTTTATGGITTGGSAGLKRTQATTATGGIVTGGAATASKTSPGQNSHTASGGITTGGAATLKRTQTATGAGGVATGGAATLKRSFAQLASGGLSTGGAALLKQVHAYLASGGLTTSGAASITFAAGAFSHTASGGITTGGSASLRILLHYLASGGVTIGGAASAYLWSSLTALPQGDPAFARLSSVARVA